MKLISDYLERAAQFAALAAEETDNALKASLERQAAEYQRLAEKRAAELKLPPVNLPAVIAAKNRNETEGPP